MASEYGLPAILLQSQQQTDWAMFAVSLLAAIAAGAAAYVAYLAFKSSTSPDVIVYVDKAPGGSMIAYLYVENIGEAPAYDVKVSVPGDAGFKWSKSTDYETSFLARGIPFLPPGGVRQTHIDSFPAFVAAMGDRVVNVDVFYRRRRGGKRMSAAFPIDGYSFNGVSLDTPKGEANLQKIAGGMASAAASLKKIEEKM